MKKLLIMSAVAVTLLSAEQGTEDSIMQQLESMKTKSTTTSGFMPDISLIVDTSYNDISFDEEGHTEHLEIPGFIHGGADQHSDHMHTPLAGEDGFNFNYAELALRASVDNYFDLLSVFHLTEDDFEVEEAYATTRSLPYHLRAKIGKFKSDFGYINNKHEHNFNFADIPLIYMSLLGDHGINEVGAQLQYVLPLSVYVMVGIEALEGENELSYGVDGFQDIDDVSAPGLWVGYLKTSFDLAGGTLLGGVSIATGDSRINHLEDEHEHEEEMGDEEGHAFAGDTTIYGIDLTYKKYFAADHAITWQSEYLYRNMDGTQYDSEGIGTPIEKKQAGFYSELIYQYDRNWRTGIRYSGITKNDISLNPDITDDIYVASSMVEYHFSEFSRVRLEYNYDSSLYTEEGEKNNKNEISLQFNYAIGAHGAHAF
ncbi:MAG: hypothetical protein EP216_03930 [Epsilonproteobacteria bacterium]|nr:MAG: hypothetical protein EP216_03930 [Campylobacterota bacterium]